MRCPTSPVEPNATAASTSITTARASSVMLIRPPLQACHGRRINRGDVLIVDGVFNVVDPGGERRIGGMHDVAQDRNSESLAAQPVNEAYEPKTTSQRMHLGHYGKGNQLKRVTNWRWRFHASPLSSSSPSVTGLYASMNWFEVPELFRWQRVV